MKEIQSQINAGAILDDVQSTNDGLTIKLTKNGKQETYNITNGKDGAKGDNGAAGQDGTVWKIGENGNWWSSEKGGEWKDTGMPSRGEKGAAGTPGRDGKYYEPNASTGTFWVVDGETKTDTGISYVSANTLTAIGQKMLLHSIM